MQRPEPFYRPRFFKSDRAVLLVCILISLIFWTLTRLSNSYKTTQECRLFYNLPEGSILASDAPDKILVSMEGSGWDLMSNYFRKEEGQLILNLNANPRQIFNTAQLISKLNRHQSSIEIKGLNIDMLELLVEDKISKKVPVQSEVELLFDPQYHLKSPLIINPDSILLSGPVSLLEHVDYWPSKSLQVKDIDSDRQWMIDLEQPKEKSISIKPEQVEISIHVEQLTEKNFFVPVVVKNAPDSIKIFPENIKISCVVGLGIYDQIGPEDFVLEVDMDGIALKEENNTLPVILRHQPEAVKGVHLSHQSVEFFFVDNQLEEE